MKVIGVLLAVVVLITAVAGAVPHPDRTATLSKIRVGQDGWYKDDAGRSRMFRGFNKVTKEWPWYPVDLGPHSNKFAHYEEWGFNVVRLGAMWQGTEPTRGHYNETYLEILKDLVQRFGDHGVYVILDMHQDVISSIFEAYDGLPKWLIASFPDSKFPYPWPLANLTHWYEGYITEGVGNAFQQFYDNTNGGADQFAKFWMKIADTFKDVPNVLGYELINEPWCGDIFRNPLLLLPGNAGRLNLAPLYDKAAAAIRQVDNTTIIFFEPVTWGYIFDGHIVGTGLDHVPGGDEYKDRSAVSFHYYCWLLQNYDMSKMYPKVDRIICDELLGPKLFEAAAADIKTLGGGGFLTEFGLCNPDGNDNSSSTIECNFVLNMIDDYLYSWAYWDSDFFFDNGTVIVDTLYYFTRPYPVATAGIPKRIQFDIETGVFNFIFMPDVQAKKPTEIYLPPMHYPNGYKVWLSPGFKWSPDPKNVSIIYIERVVSNDTRDNGIHETDDASVMIVPL